MRVSRLRFSVTTLMLAVAVVAIIYPTFVSVVSGVAQRPELFQPTALLEAAFTSQNGAAIAIIILLIMAWSTAFTLWFAVRAARRAVTAAWRVQSRTLNASGHPENRDVLLALDEAVGTGDR